MLNVVTNDDTRPISGKGDETSNNHAQKLDRAADLHLSLGLHSQAERLSWLAAQLRAEGAV